MKYSTIFCLGLLLVIAPVAIFAQSDKEKALALAYRAVDKMDNGELDESIALLKEAQVLDPNNFDIPYEMAFAHYRKEDYETAIAILKPLEQHKDVSANYFQLLGNSYDMLKDSDQALDSYRRGLKKFPNEGKLYLEQGNVFWAKGDYNHAVPYYEKGIQVDPAFPSNYYRAALVFCNSSERIWGLLYGEIFMNLERNSARTAEISELLFKTFQKSVSIESGSKGDVNFSQNIVVAAGKKFKLPFQLAFGADMAAALGLQMLSKEKQLTLGGIHAMRDQFLDFWYEQHKEKEYPNILLDYQRKLAKSGHLEAYNHWIFMKGDEDAFTAWEDAHADQWSKFVDWFKKNPMEIGKKQFFCRTQYD